MRGTKRGRLTAAVATVGLSVMGLSMTASANLPGSTFEGGDGNFVVNTAGNTDWAALNAEQQANLSVGADLLSGQTDNSFGNGTKTDDLNVTVGLGSIPNNKADLGNSYITSETLANGNLMLYLGITRVTTSGTVNLDIEINQNEQPDLTTPGPKTLVRAGNGVADAIPDDILIGYDFQGGSQRPTLTFRRWNSATATWSGPIAIGAANGEAEVNRVALTNPLAVPPSPTNAPAFTFGEASINLTGLGLVGANDCSPFSSAYVKSRASSAFTSAVKDFIAPQELDLDNCGSLTIEKQTSPDGATQSFDFEVNGSGIGAEGDFSLTDGQSTTFGGLTPGVFTAAEVNIDPAWTLDSFVCDDGSPVTAINIGNNEDVTCVATNSLQVGSLLIHKERKHAADGPGDHDHEGVTFTVTNANDPTLNEVVVTDANGEACISGLLHSTVAGDYTVTESVPTGYVAVDAEQDYTVVVGTDCETATPLEFDNTPLTNLTISVDSQIDGGTASTVDCGLPGDPIGTDVNGDVTITTNDLEPTTLVCTIVIDP